MPHTPSSSIWLDFRSGAPGLQGPFLQEFNAPYRYLDKLARQSPRIILAIGGQLKRKYLAEHMSIVTHIDEVGTVCLRSLPDLGDALIVDCELHLREDPPRVLGGPCPGHYRIHCLGQAGSTASVVARRFYCEILAQFSTEILIFAADFYGLENVIEFLVQWILGVMTMQIPTRPFIHLIVDEAEPISNKEMWLRISGQLLKQLRILEPTKPYSYREVQQIGRDCLNIQTVQHQMGNILANWASPNALRLTRGRDFPADHLRFLLTAAIRHFVKQWTSPFNVFSASRENNPLPQDWEYHILNSLSKEAVLSQHYLLASALAMEAFPPSMHHFSPENMFTHLFIGPLVSLARTLRRPNLCMDVRQEFVQFVNEAFRSESSIATLHLRRIKIESSTAVAVWDTCFCCMIRVPIYTLLCRHRLCGTCVAICGKFTGPWTYTIARCPLCDCFNDGTVALKPRTASTRVLDLSGLSPENTMQFLADVQRKVGLATMPLREHFDVVVASDFGVFFVIAMFLEGWSEEDCRYHVRRIKHPKFSKNGCVSFGNGLNWDLNDIKYKNAALVLIRVGKRRFSNFLSSKALSQDEEVRSQLTSISHAEPDMAVSHQYPYVSVQYAGGSYSSGFLKSVASTLTANLFYLELSRIPSFYTSPEVCHVYIRCRLKPGNALLDLLMSLQRQRSRLSYRGDGLSHNIIPLCGKSVIRMCQEGKPFSRSIRMSLYSLESSLDVRVEVNNGEAPQCISNCPYKLGQLVHDQELDRMVSRRQAQAMKPSAEMSYDAGNQLSKLQKTLADFAKSINRPC